MKLKLPFIVIVAILLVQNNIAQTEVNSDYWSATDALGRTALPWFAEGAEDKKPEKFVGIFYHTWHIDHHVDYSYAPKNLTQILAANNESTIEQDWNNSAWSAGVNGPDGSPIYYWDESLFGYYKTTDEWVLRKHAEMLADAGVDVVFFDATNGSVTWKEGYEKLLEVWKQAKADGVKVPKVAFVLTLWDNIKDGPLAGINELYEDIYQPGIYDDMVFYWQGKPLIMAYPEILDNVPTAGSAALKFTASKSFTNVTAGCPSYADNVGNLTLTLYKWNTNYATTILGDPIASKEFVDYADNAHLDLYFTAQEAGEYLWTLTDAKQTVGVWKYDQATAGVQSYLNGGAITGGFHSQIKYVNEAYNWITSGTSNTPYQVAAGYDPVQISEIRNYFTFRPGQGDYVNGPDYGRRSVDDTKATQWGWLETYPQHGFGKKSDNSYEQVTVGIAQNASIYSNDHCTAFNGPSTYGRNYSKKTNTWDNSENAMYKGVNFQEQWNRAHELDPDLVFVTGWNEWTVARWKNWGGCTGYSPVIVAFQDAVDGMRSRDIEPVKSWGKYGDAYYLQLVDNVRKFKGMNKQESASVAKTISVSSFNSWADVKPEFNHYKGNTMHRNYDGAGTLGNYVNNNGRNDIVKAKVARDASNVYFYVETAENITATTDPKWMRLFIDVDRNKTTGWEGYDYVLNRVNPGAKATIEQSNGTWSWTSVGQVDYAVSGNMMEVAIPRTLLGLDSEDEVQIEFKWSDNSQEDGDIMDFYVNGDAAPGGRFNFTYFSNDPTGIEDAKAGSVVNVKTYPNPFKEELNIEFEMPVATDVNILVYSITGQQISSLANNFTAVGINKVTWDGCDHNGNEVAPGMYFVRAVTDNGRVSGSSVIIKH